MFGGSIGSVAVDCTVTAFLLGPNDCHLVDSLFPSYVLLICSYTKDHSYARTVTKSDQNETVNDG